MEREIREYTRKRDSVVSLLIGASFIAAIPLVNSFLPYPTDKKEYRTASATYSPSSNQQQEEPLQSPIDKKDLTDLLRKYANEGSVVCNQENGLYFSVDASPFSARLEVGSLRPSKSVDYLFTSQKVSHFEEKFPLIGSKEEDTLNGSSLNIPSDKERENLMRLYHLTILPKIIDASKKDGCAPLKQVGDSYDSINLPSARYVLGSLFPNSLTWRDSPKSASIPAEEILDPNSKTSAFAAYRFDAGLGQQFTFSFGSKNYIFVDGIRSFSGPFDDKLDYASDGKTDIRGRRAESEFGNFFRELRKGIFSHYQHTLSDKLAARGLGADMPEKYRIVLERPSTLRVELSGNEGIALDYSPSRKQITKVMAKEDAFDLLVDSPWGHPISKEFFSPRLLETEVSYALKKNHDMTITKLEDQLKNQVPSMEEFRLRSVVSNNGRFWPKWNVWKSSQGTQIERTED